MYIRQYIIYNITLFTTIFSKDNLTVLILEFRTLWSLGSAPVKTTGPNLKSSLSSMAKHKVLVHMDHWDEH